MFDITIDVSESRRSIIILHKLQSVTLRKSPWSVKICVNVKKLHIYVMI